MATDGSMLLNTNIYLNTVSMEGQQKNTIIRDHTFIDNECAIDLGSLVLQ